MSSQHPHIYRIRGGGREYSSRCATKRRQRTRKRVATTPLRTRSVTYRPKKRNRNAKKKPGSFLMGPLSRYGNGTALYSYVDAEKVQRQWEETIKYDCEFVDPCRAENEETYDYIMDTNESGIEEMKKKVRLGNLVIPQIDFAMFRLLQHDRQLEVEKLYRFEVQGYKMKNRRCHLCHGVYLDHQFATLSGKQCKTCSKTGNRFSVENNIHPVWYDEDGNVQWRVPEELKCLRLGEQMLIQRYSPLVPLVHIKNGVFGCTGHVCCFPQNVGEICHIFSTTSIPGKGCEDDSSLC